MPKYYTIFCYVLFFGYNVGSYNNFMYEEEFNNSLESDLKYDYYFAYGSNMLKRRMLSNVRRAVFRGPVVLKKYRLDFDNYLPFWGGAIATICEDPSEEVWGVLWVMKRQHSRTFNSMQEGPNNLFKHLYVVVSNDHNEYVAFTHVTKKVPKKLPPWSVLPRDRRPSDTYLQVLINGAMEGGLPKQYVKKLIDVPSNGEMAGPKFRRSFGVLSKSTEKEELKFGLNFEVI